MLRFDGAGIPRLRLDDHGIHEFLQCPCVEYTKYQEKEWPKYGFECQVNNSHSDWKKTGSFYDLVNVSSSPARDNQWWTQHIIVNGNKATVKVNGTIVFEYTEPAGAQPGKDFTRKLDEGTFALQAHDPKSVIRYKNIRVKRLD